jgi:hypothetical protein
MAEQITNWLFQGISAEISFPSHPVSPPRQQKEHHD